MVTCVSENVVYAIKCHACHKIYIEETGRRWGRDLGSIYTPQGYQTQIFVMDDIQTTLDILVSVVRSGFRNATDRRSFEARLIFIHRTLPALWWSLCGLWFHIKSAHAVNVAIFVFYFSIMLQAHLSVETIGEERVLSKRLVHI